MDETLFTEFFGNTPLIRVLNYLLENRLFDCSKTDIARGAGVSRAALYAVWPGLEKRGIVRVTRSFGRTRLYALNDKSNIVRKLREIEYALIKRSVEELEKKQTRSVSVMARKA